MRSHFGTKGTFDPRFHVPGSAWEPPAVAPPVTAFIHDLEAALCACFAAEPAVMCRRPVSDNMTPEQRRAMFELQHDPSIVVKPSDKNMGLCILDRSWYEMECNRQLGDAATYQPVAANTIPALCESLQQQALKLVDLYQAFLPADVYKYLQAASHDAAVVPYFYLLPKVHKLPAVTREHLPSLKGRPIAACHSWVTNALSVYLADVLNGVCYTQYPQVLPDSKALVCLLEHTSAGKDAWLVTFDVESMYPSINNADAVAACAQAAAKGGHRGDLVTDLLSFVMDHGYCQFGGAFYKQIKGTVMGTPVAPPYSNIYIAQCLESAVKADRLRDGEYWPEIYKRFIDDGFFVWERDEASLLAFLQQLNTRLGNIRLTWQYSQSSIDYMDLTVTKCAAGAGSVVPLKVTTYQKPHNQYMYIPYHSFHRRGVFKGFIKAELQRYAVTNTQQADFDHMKALFMQRLVDRGYPIGQLQRWFAAVGHSCREALLSRPPVPRRLASHSPVLVLPNGQFEMTANIAAVLNSVYAQHSQHPAVASIFGGSNARLIVAYYKNRSLGARLIRARH